MEVLIYSVIISFFITLAIGVIAIPMLRRLKFGQQVRDDGPKTHLKKAGTPTMGGIIFLIPISIIPVVLSKGSLDFTLATVLVTLGFGLTGFMDDFIKIIKHRSLGLRAYQKLLAQIAIGVAFSFYAYKNIGSSIIVPFTQLEWDLGLLYIPAMTFIIIGTVNSVNFTDGLDGLASGVTLIVAVTLSIIAGSMTAVMREEGMGIWRLTTATDDLCQRLAGACLGFIKFNTYPARCLWVIPAHWDWAERSQLYLFFSGFPCYCQ